MGLVPSLSPSKEARSNLNGNYRLRSRARPEACENSSAKEIIEFAKRVLSCRALLTERAFLLA